MPDPDKPRFSHSRSHAEPVRSPVVSDDVRHELVTIQYLRGIAALMIVAFHANIQVERAGLAVIAPEWLAAGVDIFFVISGCIMWLTTASISRGGTIQFYWKRLTRIVPLYWLLTSFTVLMMLAFPAAVQSGKIDPHHILSSYLFIPAKHPVLGTMQPVLVPGWTLNYEMFFYAIFGILLLIPLRFRLGGLAAAFGLLVLAGLLVGSDTDTIAGFYTAPIILEFVGGAFLGWAYLRFRPAPRPVAWALLLSPAVLLAVLPALFPSADRLFVYGVPAVLTVAGALSLDRCGAVSGFRLPRLIGDASYSIYLTHGLLLSAIGQVWRKADLIGGGVLFTILSIAAASGVGIALHFLFERPIMHVVRTKSLPDILSGRSAMRRSQIPPTIAG